MFKRIKLRFQDMKTISKLMTGADEHAHLNGKEEPGAEHFVLSALNLEDGSAQRVFEKMDADADTFKEAINQQYSDALASIGIESEVEISPDPIKSGKMFHNAQPSGQALMKALYALKQNDKDRPLLGAHVLSVAAEMEQGIVARAFKVMGIDKEKLTPLIQRELSARY